MAITFTPVQCPKHIYSLYGKPSERCIRCGMQNPEVTQYVQALARAMQNGDDTMQIVHPYVRSGKWSARQRDRYLRGK